VTVPFSESETAVTPSALTIPSDLGGNQGPNARAQYSAVRAKVSDISIVANIDAYLGIRGTLA